MSYSTPIVNSVTAFDASAEYNYPFSYSGTQYTKINCIIATNVATPATVVNDIVESYASYFKVVSSRLANGSEYTIKIRVGDGTTWSNWSSDAVFRCFSTGIPTITNVTDGGIVESQSFTFTGSYTAGQTDALRSYRFILYNVSGAIISTQDEVFSGAISYAVSGLTNDAMYSIELRCISNSGMSSSSGKIDFRTAYIQPVVSSVVEVANVLDEGDVRIMMNLIQRSGNGSCVSYVDGEWVDATAIGSYVKFTEGLDEINSDFCLYIWMKGVVPDKTLITVTGALGNITIAYSRHRFKAVRDVYDGGLVSNHFSPLVVVAPTDEVCMRLMSVNNAIDFRAEVVS